MLLLHRLQSLRYWYRWNSQVISNMLAHIRCIGCVFQSHLSKMSKLFPKRKLEKHNYVSRELYNIQAPDLYQSIANDLWIQWYQYRKDCNLYSDNTAKKVKHHYFLPSELLIYNPSRCPVVPQSAQSSSCNHNRLWNGGTLGQELYRCINVSKNIFREGTDIAVLNKLYWTINLFRWVTFFIVA